MKSFLWGLPQFLYLASSTNCRLQVDLPQPAEARNDAERGGGGGSPAKGGFRRWGALSSVLVGWLRGVGPHEKWFA